VNGGRQDYMNWWHECREVTMEISYTKLLPASQLPAHWNYNRVSFLNYLENALYGVRGIVTDLTSGLPIPAKITVVGHDFNHSEVYTDPDVGDYHRMLDAGTYNLEFTAPGYLPYTEYSVVVTDNQTTIVNVTLDQSPDTPVIEFVDHTACEAGPDDTVTMKITLENIGGGNAYNLSGVLSTEDSYITVTQPTSAYPTLFAEGGKETSVSDYEFVISPDSPDLRNVEFKLNLTADGGFSDSLYFNFFVGERVMAFSDDFSFDLGWTGLGGSGEWTIGPATGGAGSDSYGNPDPSTDHSPGTDNYLLGNDLTGGTGGDYSSSLGATYWVTSPYIDCSGFSGVQLTFYRWLGVESGSYDRAYLQANNGSSWITVFENGGSTINESSWNPEFYDLSQYADSNPDFQIRFGIGPTDGGMNYCGWNIDDIGLQGYGEPPTGSPDISYSPTSLTDRLHLGDTATDTVKSYNTGEALLRVRFSSTDAWLEFNEEQQNISVGDSLILPVTVSTDGLTPGDYAGDIEFTSNDPDSPTGSIAVNLHIYSPEIFLPETSVQESLSTGEQSSMPFVIANNGPGRLEYEINSMMFNGKLAEAPAPKSKPLGYRIFDGEKSPSQEPFFAPTSKDYGGPDNWGYLWVDSDDPEGPAFEWIDISTSGIEIEGLGDDDTSSAIAIGFDFPFYENSCSDIYIGSNGILTFGSGSSERSNLNIPNSADPDNMIALWWDDLDPRKGGHIYYYFDSENSQFIVSFVEIANYFSTTGTGSLSFQAILFSDGKIMLQYAVMDPGSDYDGLAGATVGIENASGDDGLQVVYNAEYMHDNLAVLFNAAGWMAVEPASGTVEPYSSDTVQIQFDAAELEAGTYNGQLEVTSNDPMAPTTDVPVILNVLVAFTCGDVNSDGSINILDVTSLINDHYKNGPEPTPPVSADADHSGTLNILDATYIINYLYKEGPEPNCP
ncbi:MAG: carboxypeptidase regulatory-like domain-containing protein, partial [Candidatus Zixiibacteriota bacterium]